LVAVMLLWAPVWASALQAAGMACCDGAMCPVHGHAARKNPSDAAAAKSAPMAGCERHGRKAAMDCTMACCHPAEASVSVAAIFVLPGATGISAPLFTRPSVGRVLYCFDSPVFDPVSPPPRTLPLSL